MNAVGLLFVAITAGSIGGAVAVLTFGPPGILLAPVAGSAGVALVGVVVTRRGSLN